MADFRQRLRDADNHLAAAKNALDAIQADLDDISGLSAALALGVELMAKIEAYRDAISDKLKPRGNQ